MKKLLVIICSLVTVLTFSACEEEKKVTDSPALSSVTCPVCKNTFRGNTTYARMIEEYGYCSMGRCPDMKN